MNNILLICLDYNYITKLAVPLTNQLNMFYLDVEKAFVYNIGNIDEVVEKCGIDYLNKQEKNVINSLSLYENTLATISVSTSIKHDVFDLLKSSYKIYYIDIPKKFLKFLDNKYKINDKNSINVMLYSEVKKYVDNKNISVITIDSLDNALEDILKGIQNEY